MTENRIESTGNDHRREVHMYYVSYVVSAVYLITKEIRDEHR